MPLVKATLAQALETLSTNPPAAASPNGPVEMMQAQEWSNAVAAYFAAVVPPSLTVAAAVTALTGQLASAFQSPGAAGPAMEAAFATFGALVGTGMAPAFIAVPPAAPVGFASLFANESSGDAATAAEGIASAIDAWAKTGTATPAAGGAPTPWS